MSTDHRHEAVNHGTYYAYNTKGCRCDACTAAGSAKNAAIRDRAQGTLTTGANGKPFNPRAPHGGITGYNLYGCRCTPCAQAGNAKNNARRR